MAKEVGFSGWRIHHGHSFFFPPIFFFALSLHREKIPRCTRISTLRLMESIFNRAKSYKKPWAIKKTTHNSVTHTVQPKKSLSHAMQQKKKKKESPLSCFGSAVSSACVVVNIKKNKKNEIKIHSTLYFLIGLCVCVCVLICLWSFL